MKLRTRLVLTFFLLAVLPLTGASLIAWLSSERSFRRVVAAEAGAMAGEIGGRMGEVVGELSLRLGRMRARHAAEDGSAFEQARKDALRAAEAVQTREVVRSVLDEVPRQEGEIPFALDEKNDVLTAREDEGDRLRALDVSGRARRGDLAFFGQGFVVVSRRDESSGLAFGIARPMGEAAAEIRRTAARNLALGLGLVVLALLGILPLTRRITRDLEVLETAAARLAGGDLEARVEVRSRDEIGQLATAFNRMARDLAADQERRLAEEGLRRELLTCQRIQAELLPHGPLSIPVGRVEGVSFAAREVGGDFFNYFALPAGELAVLVGDVSGKGIAAALLMANVQATLRGSVPLAWDLAAFAASLDEDLHARTPAEAYLTLFLGIVDPQDRVLRYVNAGHNPPYVLRRGGGIELLDSTGRPLGLLPGGGYAERRIALAEGDTLLLYTDGVVDLENEAGGSLGTEGLLDLLKRNGDAGEEDFLPRLAAALRNFRGAKEPPDDATLVVLRLGG
jgi:serine phosphatase RsbU (regulator of sigma subunit)